MSAKYIISAAIAFAVIVVGVLRIIALAKRKSQSKNGFRGEVTRIVDGDTMHVGDQPVRLFGANAPEKHEQGGTAATAYLKRIAFGKYVSCHAVSKSYDRLVCRCYLPDGTEISQKMIESGHATEANKYSKGYYAKIRGVVFR